MDSLDTTVGGDGDLLLNSGAVSVVQSNRTLIEYYEEHPRAGIVWGRLVDHSGLPLQAMGDPPSLFRLVVDMPIAWTAKPVGSRGIFRRLLGRCSMKFHHASRSGACHGCQGHSCVAGVQSGMKFGALMNRSLYFEDVDLCLRVTQSGWEV